MSHFNIADLAVLGIVQRDAVSTFRVITVAKAMVPDLWNPTADVIESAVLRNLQCGFLTIQDRNSANNLLALTSIGVTQLHTLLLYDPGQSSSSVIQAAETVQFCLLDATDAATAERVLCRLRGRLQERTAAFYSRCERCTHQSRYARLWMDVEQHHLETMAQMLATVASESTDPTTHC